MINASADGDVATIRRLVAEGADVNVQGDGRRKTEDGRPLHFAALNGHVDAVRVLLELGADKEASADDGGRPLYLAAQNGHVAVVKTLVELGADKEAATADGGTPLHVAAGHGHVETVTALVELGTLAL